MKSKWCRCTRQLENFPFYCRVRCAFADTIECMRHAMEHIVFQHFPFPIGALHELLLLLKSYCLLECCDEWQQLHIRNSSLIHFCEHSIRLSIYLNVNELNMSHLIWEC